MDKRERSGGMREREKERKIYLLALTKAVFFLASLTSPIALTFLLKDLTRLS